MKKLKIAGEILESRLLLGTGKFPSKEIIPEVIKASGTQIVTVALRRVDLDASSENLLKSFKTVPIHF